MATRFRRLDLVSVELRPRLAQMPFRWAPLGEVRGSCREGLKVSTRGGKQKHFTPMKSERRF